MPGPREIKPTGDTGSGEKSQKEQQDGTEKPIRVRLICCAVPVTPLMSTREKVDQPDKQVEH